LLLSATNSVHHDRVRNNVGKYRLHRVSPAHAQPTGHPEVRDAASQAIVAALQQDGRRSYAGIGKAVGLSEAAVRQRVQRMVDAGVMQIVAVTDPMQLGFARQAMIGIRCTGDTTKLADKLAAIDSVDYVVLTAGSFDAIVEVVCEDDDDLLDLLNTKIRALPGVMATETLVYLKLVKQQYNWGAR
jgi:Lrp/AsnC family transcriptional regulator, regulator for asnA, asnC and gidA